MPRPARTLLLLTLSLALPAAAQSVEVKKFLNATTALYENLEYEKALKQLAKAKVKASSPEDEAKIALLEGIVLADMGREDKALTSFKTAFGIDLEAKLPLDVGPKVLAVAERARANVRKVLAPALAEQKADEERRAAEDKQRAERAAQVAQLAAEEKRRLDEEQRRNAPPPAVLKSSDSGPSVRTLSWVPGAVGLVSAGVGTAFLVSAGGKRTALLNGTVDLATANDYRASGPTDATLGSLFIGVGIAGVLGAAAMFVFGAPGPRVAVVPTREGVMVALSGSFDFGGSR